MATYREEAKRAMNMLAEDERVIFLGQSVRYPGSIMLGSLEDISDDRKIEMPIAEDMQTGIATGLSLQGFVPVSIYPRWDFALLGINQMINHLDKMSGMSLGKLNPKVILRTTVGARYPLHAGPQHTQDHTEALRELCTNIDVFRLDRKGDVFPTYQRALENYRSSLIVEVADLYDK
tara:strand:+ start:1237 stop:1767 length:531 start_codon:yes stop_codon:yes gene_type:complete